MTQDFSVSGNRHMAFVILASLAIVLLLFLSALIALDFNADGGIHWFHDLNILVFILVLLVVGLAAQLRAPAQRVAAMQQVLVAAGGIVVAAVLSVYVFPPVVVVPVMALAVAALHPVRRQLLSAGSVSISMLVLAVIAAAPLVLYAFEQTAILRSGETEVHANHWLNMGALALGIALVAVVAALRASGWRISAWSAGIAAVAFGALSIALPSQASSVGVVWGIVAILWGAAFVATAEIEARRATERTGALAANV